MRGIEGQRGGQCEPSRPGMLGAAPEAALMTVVFSQFHSHHVLLRNRLTRIYLHHDCVPSESPQTFHGRSNQTPGNPDFSRFTSLPPPLLHLSLLGRVSRIWKT